MNNVKLVRLGAQAYRRAQEAGEYSELKSIAEAYPDFAKAFLVFRDALKTDDAETLKELIDVAPELAFARILVWPNIYQAAVTESAKCATLLLTLGVDPNEKHKNTGATPIAAAARKANLEVVTLLHEGGATLDTSTMAANPLIGAVHSVVPQETRGKGLPVALYLIDAGIDTTATYETDRPIPKINALQFAVEMGARDIARAIGLHQTGGDEVSTQALIDEAIQIAEANTVPPENGS